MLNFEFGYSPEGWRMIWTGIAESRRGRKWSVDHETTIEVCVWFELLAACPMSAQIDGAMMARDVILCAVVNTLFTRALVLFLAVLHRERNTIL
jgi:hypothetical protein